MHQVKINTLVELTVIAREMHFTWRIKKHHIVICIQKNVNIVSRISINRWSSNSLSILSSQSRSNERLLGLLLLPKLLKLIRHSQINCYSNYISIFHGLFYLYVFIAKDLYLLTVIPK